MNSCPSCTGKQKDIKKLESNFTFSEVYTCKRCGAIFGKGDNIKNVLNFLSGYNKNINDEYEVYPFDFNLVDEDRRSHGWYDVKNNEVFQWG